MPSAEAANRVIIAMPATAAILIFHPSFPIPNRTFGRRPLLYDNSRQDTTEIAFRRAASAEEPQTFHIGHGETEWPALQEYRRRVSCRPQTPGSTDAQPPCWRSHPSFD